MFRRSSPVVVQSLFPVFITAALLGSVPPLSAEEAPESREGGVENSPSPAQAVSLDAQGAPPSADEPEEPDFAFVTGGPYTQKKTSPQIIFPSFWSRRTSTVGGVRSRNSEFGMLLRTEYGLTDRWELDVIFSASGERAFEGSQRLVSTFAMDDSVVGVRYRLLQESSAPITLTMGPQLIIPTGSFASGTGNSSVGYAWDLAAAKDWGGPVFVYASANYSFFPSVRPELAGAPQHFPLHNIFGATALVFRPLEKPMGPNHHDIHLFFEYGLGREEGLELEAPVRKTAATLSLFAPGIRYGLLTRGSKLFEFGISFPMGLNQSTPRGGIILQVQIENLFGYRGE